MSGFDADVIVVGAGPAGSTAAKITASAGLSTLIIERRAHVGLPVQCGEFVPSPREIKDLFPRCSRGARLVVIPSRFVSNSCSRINLFSPNLGQFGFRFAANVIDRALYDPWLASEAQTRGAELRLNSTVLGLKSANEVVFRDKDGTHSAKGHVIVGADGPHSCIAHSLGREYMTGSKDLTLAIQYILAGVDCRSNEIEMYFGNQVAPGGYAWIIPKGGSIANVGLGIRSQFSLRGSSLKTYLHHFVKRHVSARQQTGEVRTLSRIAALIPVGGPVSRSWSEHAILAGDAAGHVMACNGGGIPSALIDGEIAGQAAVRHISEGIPLSSYETTWRKEIGSELRTALMILRVADQVMPSDKVTEICMHLARSHFLESLIRCRLPLSVDVAAKTLVKVLKVMT